jgi:hypothetical protein
MAVTSGQVTAGTVAMQIDGSGTSPYFLIIQNDSNTAKLHLGGPNVTVSNGMALAGNQFVEMRIAPNDHVWIVADSDGHPVSWLRWDV